MKEENYTIIEKVKDADQLPPAVISDLQSTFDPLFLKANEWAEKAKSIKVEDVSEVEKMKEARNIRLELKGIRTNADKARKQLKEDLLLKGRAIDGMYNIIKFLVKPLEGHLEEQEKFIQRKEEKRIEGMVADRESRMSQYVDDLTVYNFKVMSEEQFTNLLDDAKRTYEAKIEEERKVEEERIAAEEAEKEKERRLAKTEFIESLINRYGLDRSIDVAGLMELDAETFDTKIQEAESFVQAEVNKIKEENERLRKEKEEQEKLAAKEKAEREKEEKIKREAQEAKIKEEQEKRKALELEIQKKKEAEEKAKEEEEKKKQKAAMAPDKEKLREFASRLLSIDYPNVTTEEAQKIVLQTQELMKKVNKHIISNLSKL